ncbi:hypothetical protein [Microbacterium sp. CPCC 204701]|uniref:hypothetical protein n=1 Tax=Microbacterium sp. CPCC 204701 TaxID=2493084 RepID=UPI000FDA6532|nr:hypothetical protein [Microbacterium sp. CPCC 204701]
MTAEAAPAESSDLRVRLAELEAENARLRAGATAEPVDRVSPDGSRWRAFLSALCIVIATILVPLAVVTAWARLELVDESAFVSTLAPLADDPAVQQMLIDETVEAVEAQVDFEVLTADVFDGIAQLGLPPRAADALQLLEAPAAEGLRNLLAQTVTRVVESDAFADTWTTTTRAAHRVLTAAATSDGGGVVVLTDEGLGIQLGTIVDGVKQNLVDRGVGIAQLIPAIDRVVIVGTGETLVTVRTVHALATALGWWLPVIAIALFATGILVARRRSTAVLGTGVGFIAGGGALALAFAIGYPVIGQAAVQLGLSSAALGAVYEGLVGSMQQTAAVVVLLGAVIAVLGWFAGRWSPAARTRRAVGSMNSSLRRRLAGHGFTAGRLGLWLARSRVVVRTLVVALAVVWLFALRPLSAGDVFLVLVVALVVAWILEILQTREEPTDAEVPGPSKATVLPSSTADEPPLVAGTVAADPTEESDAMPAEARAEAVAPASVGAKRKPRAR